jgi:hypothetical protein
LKLGIMHTRMPFQRSQKNERRHGRLYDGHGASNRPYSCAR